MPHLRNDRVDVAFLPGGADDHVAQEPVSHLVTVLRVDPVAARVPEDVLLN